jgi:hypothetical protein
MEEFLLLIGLRLQLETFGAVPNCPNVAEKFIPENSISTFLFRCRDKKNWNPRKILSFTLRMIRSGLPDGKFAY